MKKWNLERKVIHVSENKLKDVSDGHYRVEINGNIAYLITPDFKKVLN
jgi:hypothetical protein